MAEVLRQGVKLQPGGWAAGDTPTWPKLTRSQKSGGKAPPESDSSRDEVSRPKLRGWEGFERDGLLR
jgi:hypothetical protein